MDDVDESSSKNNIVVINISHFTGSPHSIDKNAYLLTLIKDGDGSNQYRSRIGFDIFSLPLGFYTLVVEFFPPDMQNVSVHASIKKQASKTFPAVGSTAGYVKTLIQFHRWQTSFNLKYIYLDLELDLHGVATSSTTGRIVVYGVSGLVSNVPSSVFDQVYVVDDGWMVLQTNLDLHGHRLANNGQGGISFDYGGVISLHDNLNTNGYRVLVKNGGGFEVDNSGRIKLHDDLDLNGHRIDGVITFTAGEIVILKNINLT